MALLPELEELNELCGALGEHARVETLAEIACGNHSFPLIGIVIGSREPTSPVLGLFAGVHGLERIGTKVLLSYLRTLGQLLRWDRVTRQTLSESRIVLVPLVNPTGMHLQRRSNHNGVDLMRNSPVRAENVPGTHLFSGHRLSPRLPWYQGPEGAAMELEAQTLCNFIRREVLCSTLAITVDVHSGYGARDRLWFPYASSKAPFPNAAEVLLLKRLLDATYPHHIYCIEPQSRQYLAHGDLWDYLYQEHAERGTGTFFLPLCLELGSWVWMKKNYRQMFSVLGVFNPLAPHRLQRTLRRHLLLFEFLHRAVISPSTWAKLSKGERDLETAAARKLWYES